MSLAQWKVFAKSIGGKVVRHGGAFGEVCISWPAAPGESCEDDPKRCNKQDCPGKPHPDDPHTQARERMTTEAEPLSDDQASALSAREIAIIVKAVAAKDDLQETMPWSSDEYCVTIAAQLSAR